MNLLHLLISCEVLLHLSHLHYIYLASFKQCTYSFLRPYLNACIKALEFYKKKARAPHVAATDSALADQLQQFNIAVSPERKVAFDKNVRQPFLCVSLENIANRFSQVELLSAFEISDLQSLLTKRSHLLHVIVYYSFLFLTMVLEIMLL